MATKNYYLGYEKNDGTYEVLDMANLVPNAKNPKSLGTLVDFTTKFRTIDILRETLFEHGLIPSIDVKIAYVNEKGNKNDGYYYVPIRNGHDIYTNKYRKCFNCDEQKKYFKENKYNARFYKKLFIFLCIEYGLLDNLMNEFDKLVTLDEYKSGMAKLFNNYNSFREFRGVIRDLIKADAPKDMNELETVKNKIYYAAKKDYNFMCHLLEKEYLKNFIINLNKKINLDNYESAIDFYIDAFKDFSDFVELLEKQKNKNPQTNDDLKKIKQIIKNYASNNSSIVERDVVINGMNSYINIEAIETARGAYNMAIKCAEIKQQNINSSNSIERDLDGVIDDLYGLLIKNKNHKNGSDRQIFDLGLFIAHYEFYLKDEYKLITALNGEYLDIPVGIDNVNDEIVNFDEIDNTKDDEVIEILYDIEPKDVVKEYDEVIDSIKELDDVEEVIEDEVFKIDDFTEEFLKELDEDLSGFENELLTTNKEEIELQEVDDLPVSKEDNELNITSEELDKLASSYLDNLLDNVVSDDVVYTGSEAEYTDEEEFLTPEDLKGENIEEIGFKKVLRNNYSEK